MIDQEKLQLINSYLSGSHTSWEEMFVAFFAFAIIGVTIFALVVTFCDNHKSDSEEQDLKRKEATKKAVSYALMITGLAAIGYGAILILGM